MNTIYDWEPYFLWWPMKFNGVWWWGWCERRLVGFIAPDGGVEPSYEYR